MDFSLSLSVVLPLCIYIFVGVLAGRLKMIGPVTIGQMNKVSFRILFPMVMFENVRSAGEALKSGEFSVLGYLVVLILVQFVLLMLLVPLFLKDRPRQGSFIQGAFRANSILFAIPVVSAICGENNTAIASMCVAVAVPVYNALCVVCLESRRGGKVNIGKMLKGVATNPLILGAICGVLFLLSGWTMPEVLGKPIKAMTSMVTPLALIILGAGLKFDGIRKDLKPLLWVSLVKLLIIPLITLVSAWACGFRGVTLVSVFALNCVPTAVSSYSMAVEMEADGPFAAEIVAFTTLLSLITVFLWVSVLSGMGLFAA